MSSSTPLLDHERVRVTADRAALVPQEIHAGPTVWVALEAGTLVHLT
jgi:hypothetical protein